VHEPERPLPEQPEAGPHVIRRAALADAGSVADVLDECTRYYLDRPSSRDDALSRLKQGDPVEDFRIAIDSNAKALGFGHVWEASPQEVRGFVRVRPSAKGLGVSAALLSWLEQRAGAIAEDVHPDAVLTLTHWAKDGDAPPVIENAGFVPIRHFLQMRIDLSTGDFLRVSWPDGLELRCFAPGRDDAELFAAFRDAFAEHSRDAEVNKADWWNENRDAPNAGFDPTLWFVASDGASIAGFSLCREREEDGGRMGWVSLLGVRPHRRGRGLGAALLSHSLRVFRDSGLRRAALNVDVDNTTGALRLYEQAGMEPVPAFTVWSKTLCAEAARRHA
jgi:mycothiol synthase